MSFIASDMESRHGVCILLRGVGDLISRSKEPLIPSLSHARGLTCGEVVLLGISIVKRSLPPGLT